MLGSRADILNKPALYYIGGLLGESERKNLSQMADNAVGVTYHRLHHFLTEAPGSAQEVNERRLKVMNQCSLSPDK